MKDFITMENESFELLIAPYVKKIVEEGSGLVTYEYIRRPKRKQISLKEDMPVFVQPNNGVKPRQILTPDGIFSNITEAADHYGITKQSIYGRITQSRRKKDGQWDLVENNDEQG